MFFADKNFLFTGEKVRCALNLVSTRTLLNPLPCPKPWPKFTIDTLAQPFPFRSLLSAHMHIYLAVRQRGIHTQGRWIEWQAFN